MEIDIFQDIDILLKARGKTLLEFREFWEYFGSLSFFQISGFFFGQLKNHRILLKLHLMQESDILEVVVVKVVRKNDLALFRPFLAQGHHQKWSLWLNLVKE